MAYDIVWTKEAELRLEEISDCLLTKWSIKELDSFSNLLQQTIDTLRNYPSSFRENTPKSYREALVSKHNLLIYKVEGKRIFLITLWDNRMNPDKKQV